MTAPTTAPQKPFKSDRAARIAFGKAERAWKSARDAANGARHDLIKDGVPEDYDMKIAPFEQAEETARVNMVEIYNAAKAQGIWIDSWELGHNPTRDLIRANMD